MDIPFSLTEVQNLPTIHCEAHYITASDGNKLAYYSFIPNEVEGVVIFYHGGGAYTNNSYKWVGDELAKNSNIAAYFFDMRGHGYSGGPRGDALTVNQVCEDINSAINFVAMQYPGKPIFLAGHSSGAGLILNFSKRDHELVKGYILISPFLGVNSGTGLEHKDKTKSFIKKVRVWVYILASITNGKLLAHTPALFFNYSDDLLDSDPLMLRYYTYTMSCAVTPNDAKALMEQIKKPVLIFIGQYDEQFEAKRVAQFIEYTQDKRSFAKILPDSKHISILLEAPKIIKEAVSHILT